MQKDKVSITAIGTAFARAHHATENSPKIFDDFLAPELFSEEEWKTSQKGLAKILALVNPELAAKNPDEATAFAWVMQTHIGPITLSRARYTEDRLKEAMDHGVRQYVILGAGLDTFAFRERKLLEKLTVFEIDFPATQEHKRERITKAGWQVPQQLHFLPIDFNEEKISQVLKNSSFDPKKPTFISWLGVSYYLPNDTLDKTLKDLIEMVPKGSTIVFDYLDHEAFMPGKAAKNVQLLQAIAAQVGEPMMTGFDPKNLAAELKKTGWGLEENLSPAQIEDLYFKGRTDYYHAFNQIHFARAIKK